MSKTPCPKITPPEGFVRMLEFDTRYSHGLTNPQYEAVRRAADSGKIRAFTVGLPGSKARRKFVHREDAAAFLEAIGLGGDPVEVARRAAAETAGGPTLPFRDDDEQAATPKPTPPAGEAVGFGAAATIAKSLSLLAEAAVDIASSLRGIERVGVLEVAATLKAMLDVAMENATRPGKGGDDAAAE